MAFAYNGKKPLSRRISACASSLSMRARIRADAVRVPALQMPAVYTVASSNAAGKLPTSRTPAVIKISVTCVQPIG